MEMRYRTTVKWNGREPGAWFYTEAATPEEAEVIVNFLLHRDYNPDGTTLLTEPDPGKSPWPTTVYYLDGKTVRSTVWK